MSRFHDARLAFAQLRSALQTDAELFSDVRQCFDLLLTRYNTQIYENRFIVGGVTERIIAAVFLALGHVGKASGVHVTRTDICVGSVKLSVKGSFRPRPTTIRMVNVMGESAAAKWDEPTIFVVSEVGIGYADPDLLPDSTKRSKDVVELNYKALSAFWKAHHDRLLPMALPFSREDKEGSDIASRSVADEILRYSRSKRLKPFDTRTHED